MLLKSLSSVALLVTISSFVFAADTQTGGFVALGQSYTSHNNFLGTGKRQHEIVELGLHLNHEFDKRFSFSGQLGYRRFGDSWNDENIRVDFANLNYVSTDLGVGEQSISLGRSKVMGRLYNASRDVPMSRPSIILPQSAYLDIFRNLMMSVDGVTLRSSHWSEQGMVSFELALGKNNIDDNFLVATLGESATGVWQESNMLATDLRFTNAQTTAGLSYTRMNPHYQAEADSLLPVPPNGTTLSLVNGNLDLRTYSAYIRYLNGNFEYSTEYVYRYINVRGFLNELPVQDRSAEGIFAQARYFATPSVTMLARFDYYNRNAEENITTLLVGSRILPAWTGKAKTLTLGLNWQISQQWFLAVEGHRVNGSAWLPPLAISVPYARQKQQWWLGAVQFAYRF